MVCLSKPIGREIPQTLMRPLSIVKVDPGFGGTQKRGHRKRLYCDDMCRQRGHRHREQETSEAWITALKNEIKRLPQHVSRSLFEARLRLYGYSTEDIALFWEHGRICCSMVTLPLPNPERG